MSRKTLSVHGRSLLASCVAWAGHVLSTAARGIRPLLTVVGVLDLTHTVSLHGVDPVQRSYRPFAELLRNRELVCALEPVEQAVNAATAWAQKGIPRQ